jgi:hypothetical protein
VLGTAAKGQVPHSFGFIEIKNSAGQNVSALQTHANNKI